MRRIFVIAACAALTVLGGAQASAQVLPPTSHAESAGIAPVLDVWAGLNHLV